MSDHDFDEPKQPAHGYHTQAAANLTQADIERKNKLFSNLIDGIGTRDRDVLCESVMLYSPDGKTELIKEARVQFVYGRKYGLVGRNGIGKSTLLRAVSNYALQGFPQHLRVVYVEQEEIEGDQRPCLQFVIESDEENNWLHSEQERLYNELENGDDSDDTFDADVIQQRLDKIDERLDEIDSRRIDMRAQSILTGLGFTNEMQHKPVTELSGGWRRRVAMACALLVYPDIMLLDEPTNHLDFAAVAWLQAYLKTVPCTLVIVSHDRDFINTICTDVIWLHHKKLDYFRGDYESFVKVKEEQNKTQQHQYEVQQKKIADTKEFINEAKTSGNPDLQRLAVTKQKMLDKLLKEELIEAPDSDKEFRFTFPKPGKLDHALLECHDMDFAYNVDPDAVTDDTPMLLHNINVNLTMESRVALLGHNGAGKTTLIKVIMGKYKPVRGVCRFNEHARAAFFTQHHVDQLNLEMSALEYLQSVHTDAKEYQIRGIMGRFGFDSQLISQKIATLSGGQKSRVAMALLTWKEPHLIIMDEPTNHLDIETIEALINAIKLFQGAVVVISHDTHFIGQVATEYWALNEQGDLHTFFELDEAKIFAYKPIQFNPDDISLKRLVAQKQAEKIESNAANKQESQKTFVRNKNKSKKGKGGIDILADEKQRIAEEQANTAAAQQALQSRQDLSDDDIEQSNIEQSVKQASKTINKKANNKQNVTASFSLLSLDIEQGMDSDEERQQRKIKKKQAALLAEAATIDAEAEAERKRIKKEKKRLKALLADDDNENVIDPDDLPDAEQEEVIDKPKKKKSSKKVDFDAVADTSDVEIELEKPKKKKKPKQTDNDNQDNDDVPAKKSSKSKSSKSADNDADEPVKQKSSKKSTTVDSDNDSTHSEQKEIAKKKKKKKNVDSDDEPAPAKQSNTRDSDDEIDTNKKKKKSSKSKSKTTNDSDNEESAKPKKSKSKSKQADSDDEIAEKPKKSKSKSKSKASVDDDAD